MYSTQSNQYIIQKYLEQQILFPEKGKQRPAPGAL